MPHSSPYQESISKQRRRNNFEASQSKTFTFPAKIPVITIFFGLRFFGAKQFLTGTRSRDSHAGDQRSNGIVPLSCWSIHCLFKVSPFLFLTAFQTLLQWLQQQPNYSSFSCNNMLTQCLFLETKLEWSSLALIER